MKKTKTHKDTQRHAKTHKDAPKKNTLKRQCIKRCHVLKCWNHRWSLAMTQRPALTAPRRPHLRSRPHPRPNLPHPQPRRVITTTPRPCAVTTAQRPHRAPGDLSGKSEFGLWSLQEAPGAPELRLTGCTLWSLWETPGAAEAMVLVARSPQLHLLALW